MKQETTNIIKALVTWNKEETVKAVSWIGKPKNLGRDEAIEALINFCVENLEDGLKKMTTSYMIADKTDKIEVCKFYIKNCFADKIKEIGLVA